jgi:quercetin dioxygenase-like cupin family protein
MSSFDLFIVTMTSITTNSTELRRSYRILNYEVNLRVTSSDSEGRFAVIEILLPGHFPGAPPHFHSLMTERFIVLEGELEVFLAGEWKTLHAGDSEVAQPKVVHGFRNPGEENTRILLVTTPGGHEHFFAELVTWMEREPVWPPDDFEALVEFGKRHDTQYVSG